MNHVTGLAPSLAPASLRTVEHVSQVGVGVFNACGVACALMLLREVGLAASETVTKWSRKIDPTQDGTTPANLAAMLKELGATPVVGTAATYPYIELVRYENLPSPLQWVTYRGHKFLHWIVRTSDTTYLDPLFPQGQGGPFTSTKATLDKAEISAAVRVAIQEKYEAPKPMAPVEAKVITEVRVRTAPTVSEATWTPLALREGETVKGEVVNGWLKYTNPQFVVYDKAGTRLDALYSVLKQGATEYIRVPSSPVPQPPPVVVPPPASKGKFQLGPSVLISHHLLEPAYQAGCRAFLIMEGLLAAVQFKQAHPDALVMYRKYIGRGYSIPDPQLFRGEAKMGNGVVFVTPLNECDGPCYGSPGEIEQRAKFDTALGQMCRDNGTIYAAGGFSMGTPDFTRPDICEAMRKFYAPGYNAGTFGMNMHLYSPNMRHVYDPTAWQWYERRWEFLFTKCGFDPDPARVGIYCDETGVDEGGVGGFPAHNASAEDVRKWSVEFKKLSELPLVIGGKSYPSPMRGAAVFQAGHQDWVGYNISPYFREIGSVNS